MQKRLDFGNKQYRNYWQTLKVHQTSTTLKQYRLFIYSKTLVARSQQSSAGRIILPNIVLSNQTYIESDGLHFKRQQLAGAALSPSGRINTRKSKICLAHLAGAIELAMYSTFYSDAKGGCGAGSEVGIRDCGFRGRTQNDGRKVGGVAETTSSSMLIETWTTALE